MLRLDATSIRLVLSEVEAYGRQQDSNDDRRRIDNNLLDKTASSKARWQSLFEQTDFPFTYIGEGSPPDTRHDALSTSELSDDDDGDDNDKTDMTLSGTAVETVGQATEQYTDPAPSVAIPRLPLPPPFASTPRMSSPSNQPGIQSIRSSGDTRVSEASRTIYQMLHSPPRRSLAVTSPYEHGAYRTPTLRVSLRRLTIYDDATPAAEIRHQGLHGSRTAPGTSSLASETSTPGSSSRRHRAGVTSPTRMDTSGRVGPFGGGENSDEAVLYDAEMRRWLVSRRVARGGREQGHDSR
ncbi:hypothetical protein CH63R_12846 [Colletotrichum higginsianum IMI 349063]|uniref:Uncharacterized protein n=1 Tax=Colletotrichum higginsianum (strain IMI 349063) TaxID=759273 RepID=A0A1B7XVB0_COLHI|nr:hypothetical protein CH63R_12846 [Colletotrichum higginsianum IMI 349063]OBR03719.1 hypothetical protein CH63R_12846 [Colletotrichum higginsianum IMI 349063]